MPPYRSRGISASLASRLSRGDKGSHFSKSFNNGRLQGRIQFPGNRRKEPVHSRLTMGKNSPRVLKVWSKTFLRSLEDIEDAEYTGAQSTVPVRRKTLQTKSNNADSFPVRITNGAVVKGLRSDQLLLQKHYQGHRNTDYDAKNATKFPRQKTRHDSLRNDAFEGTSKVSMNYNSGLTVSFTNDSAKSVRDPRRRRLLSNEVEVMSTSSYSSSDEDEVIVRKSQKSKIDPESTSFIQLNKERPPPPKPHRQILDPQIQKEIAILQGRVGSTHSGPGPGVKNFRMIPTITKYKLSQRFTIEKMQ